VQFVYPYPGLKALEHGGVLEHVGYDHEPDPAPPDEDVLQLRHLAVLQDEEKSRISIMSRGKAEPADPAEGRKKRRAGEESGDGEGFLGTG
jgi:hypothetical protein